MAPKNQRWWLTEDSVSLDIDADAETLYAMVSDLPRIGHNAVGPGSRIRYARHGEVQTAEPAKAFSFVTDEGGRPSTAWHYTFADLGGGRTRVTEGYEVRWIPTWARILDVPTNRHKDLLKGMRSTLENLKAAAESSTRTPS